MKVLNKDVFIVLLGKFYKGDEVTILERHGKKRKVRIKHAEFFIDADSISTSNAAC